MMISLLPTGETRGMRLNWNFSAPEQKIAAGGCAALARGYNLLPIRGMNLTTVSTVVCSEGSAGRYVPCRNLLNLN
jgi:hypothetical protein